MTNPTDTNQASELRELCKKVYERTKWGDWSQPDGGSGQTDAYWKHLKGETEKEAFVSSEHSGWSNSVWIAPLYTSDYLLERLPVYSDDGEGMLTVTTRQGVERNGWMAYYEDVDGYSVSHEGIGKSPLLALLKLTIALSEAGELK